MANNVTFIVGNGLDLSLGLKTSFRDFYSYISTTGLHPENRIYKAMGHDPETWADFELALGKYTWYIENAAEDKRENESVKLHDDLEILMHDLAEYLISQENLASNLAGNLDFGRHSFYEELPWGPRGIVQAYIAANSIDFNFVTLNYTKTLEKILPNKNQLAAQGVTINRVHHLHGDLLENLTLGLSYESQIFDGMSVNERDDLIKPRLITSMYDGRIETFKRIINSSLTVVLFGTSIGESDRYIWDYLVQWLAEHSGRHIIIHEHNNEYTEHTKLVSRSQKMFMRAVQNKLLGASINTMKKDLRSRIFVIHNTKKLFAAKVG